MAEAEASRIHKPVIAVHDRAAVAAIHEAKAMRHCFGIGKVAGVEAAAAWKGEKPVTDEFH